MDLHIDDLKISAYTKNILHELGFAMVSDLEGHDYISLIQKFPTQRHRVYSIIQELNNAGYLLPPNNAVLIYDVPCPKGFYIFLREIISYTYPNYRYAQKRSLHVCAISESRR